MLRFYLCLDRLCVWIWYNVHLKCTWVSVAVDKVFTNCTHPCSQHLDEGREYGQRPRSPDGSLLTVLLSPLSSYMSFAHFPTLYKQDDKVDTILCLAVFMPCSVYTFHYSYRLVYFCTFQLFSKRMYHVYSTYGSWVITIY